MTTINTVAACAIADLNRDRLNEYIHAGAADFVPKTIAGRSRRFSVDDTLALVIFGCLLREGWSPGAAGREAKRVREAISAMPAANTIYVQTTRSGAIRWGVEPIDVVACAPVLSTRAYEVGALREAISEDFAGLLQTGLGGAQ